MATGSKFIVRMVTDATNTLNLSSITIEPFTYDAGFNTAADIPLSSGGYLPQVNIVPPGNSSAGNAAIVCNVKVEDNYSLDHEYVAYNVSLSFGSAAIPAMTTTFATFVALAETAIQTVVTDTNSTPQGPYAVGGGGAATGPYNQSGTGPI